MVRKVTMTDSFWDFPRYCKYDELNEVKHAYLWKRALRDPETGIERINKDYILYGREEALLLRPKMLVMRVGLDLYDKMLSMFRRE